MTSSLYFLPPISSPPWPLISSKISSVAFLCGIPQGAAGPERGVEIPNLMMPAAPATPGLRGTTTAAARSVVHVTERHGFIAIPPGCWALSRWPGTRTIETRIVGCQSHRRRALPTRDSPPQPLSGSDQSSETTPALFTESPSPPAAARLSQPARSPTLRNPCADQTEQHATDDNGEREPDQSEPQSLKIRHGMVSGRPWLPLRRRRFSSSHRRRAPVTIA